MKFTITLLLASLISATAVLGQPRPVEIIPPVDPPVILPIAPAVVQVRASTPLVREGSADPGVFTVHRTGRLSTALKVRYALSGTADNGTDYKELSGEVTIPEGRDAATVEVHAAADALAEGRETVKLTLLQLRFILPPGPEDDYLVGEASAATVVIYDATDPRPTAPKVAIDQPASGTMFPPGKPIEVEIQAADADGYITGAALYANERLIDSVTLNYLVAPPPGEIARLNFTWKEPPGGEFSLVARARDDSGLEGESTPVKILVRPAIDRVVVTVIARDPVAVENEPGNTGAFAFHRTGDLASGLKVAFDLSGSAENGVDYETISEEVEFAPGTAVASVLVTPIPDKALEGAEQVIVTLRPATTSTATASPAYVVGEPRQARVIIHDGADRPPAPPRVEITQPSSGAVFREGADIQISGIAADADGYLTGIDLFINERHADSWITLLPPEAPGQSTMRFKFDWKQAPAGDFVLQAVATDNSGLTTRSEPVKVSVVTVNEIPVVTIETTDAKASESDPTDTGEFIVKRTGSTDRPLQVFFDVDGTAEEGVDYARLGRFVTIPAGKRSAEILVRAIPDRETEGDEIVTVRLTHPPTDSLALTVPGALVWPAYRIGEPAQARVLIVEDGTPGSRPRVVITSPASGSVFADGATITIQAEARDADGYITGMRLLANERIVGSEDRVYIVPPPAGEPAAFTFVWENVPAGDYKLVAVAVDDAGLKGESAAVKIMVRAPYAQIVTITAPDPEADETDPENVGVFQVTRHRPTDDLTVIPGSLTVYYAVRGTAENGVDYETLPGSVTLREGEASARILVRAIDDDQAEGRESVIVQLIVPPSLPDGPRPMYAVGEPGAATVIILDHGEHSPFVRRDLPDTYTPGSPVNVLLQANPLDVVTVYAVEDHPPRGWRVSAISQDGTFDAATGKVKFGPFLDNQARNLTYQATPPADTAGPREFAGIASANGHDSRIAGDRVIVHGRIHHPADRNPEDFFIRIGELTAYATAWKRGEEWPGGPNPIPQSYVTRAGEIWRKGEAYVFDPSAGPAPLWWVPKNASDEAPPIPQLTLQGRVAPEEGADGMAIRTISVGHPPGQIRVVSITVRPKPGTRAWSLEEMIPPGWPVRNISHEGFHDEAAGYVRWGLFLDDEPRTVSYEIHLPTGQLRGGYLQGAVSLDGVELPVRGGLESEKTEVRDLAAGRLRNLVRHAGDDVEVSFAGEIGRRYVIQASSDLIHWTDLEAVVNLTGDVQVIDRSAADASVRYYRAKPTE